MSIAKVVARHTTFQNPLGRSHDELRRTSILVQAVEQLDLVVAMKDFSVVGVMNRSGHLFNIPVSGHKQVAESFEALVISSERERGRILAAILGEHGVVTTHCSPLEAEQTVLSRDSVRLAFCDSRSFNEVYPDLRHVIHSRQSRIVLVIFTNPGEPETSLQIQGLEDVDFISPPFESAAIAQIIQKAIARKRAIASEESNEEGH